MSGPFLETIPKGFLSGEINISDSATQLSDIDCQMAMLQALPGNTGNVYIGIAGVTVAEGTADETSGFCLTPGDMSPWIPCENLSDLYAIAATADDDLIYFLVL